MPDKYFIDTNLWIYFYLDSERREDKRKQQQVFEVLQQPNVFYVSTQVLNELSAVLCRKYAVSPDKIRNYIREILSVAEARMY